MSMNNNAPEKLWIDPATDLPKLSGYIDKDSVEYVRTDAFIEKACSILKDISCPFEIIEQFKNRIR